MSREKSEALIGSGVISQLISIGRVNLCFFIVFINVSILKGPVTSNKNQIAIHPA
jgi:hypothetical protein